MRQVQALEQLLDQVGAFDQVAHEDEQRDRDEHVVAHHLEGATAPSASSVFDVPGTVFLVGDPGEDHAHAHQRERRRESPA
jgi:hypothetical protein